ADFANGRKIDLDIFDDRPFRAVLAVVPDIAGLESAERNVRDGKIDHAVRMVRSRRPAAMRAGKKRLRGVDFRNRHAVDDEHFVAVEAVKDARPYYRHISVIYGHFQTVSNRVFTGSRFIQSLRRKKARS